jgi:isopenicillin N synthase-like dioxygenase
MSDQDKQNTIASQTLATPSDDDLKSINVIPIIDLSDPKAGELILNACHNHGFFYIDNTKGQEIDIAVTDKIIQKSKAFHNLSQEEKDKYAIEKSKHHRGYLSKSSFFANRNEQIRKNDVPTLEVNKSKPTSSESLNFHSANFLNDIDKSDVKDGNVYPNELGDDFENTVSSYRDGCLALFHKIFKHLEPFLNKNNVVTKDDTPIKEWQDAFHDLTWLFRCIYYPPTNGELVQHTDKGVLTILLQDKVEGLQVWFQDKWVNVPPIKNTFVVNVADMLQEMSCKTLHSTLHRVINSGDVERFSIPFFIQLGKSTKTLFKGETTEETKWVSQYQHMCNHQYRIYQYLYDQVKSSNNQFDDMTPEQIDEFHSKIVSRSYESNA